MGEIKTDREVRRREIQKGRGEGRERKEEVMSEKEKMGGRNKRLGGRGKGERQTDRQTGRQAGRQANRPADRQEKTYRARETQAQHDLTVSSSVHFLKAMPSHAISTPYLIQRH